MTSSGAPAERPRIGRWGALAGSGVLTARLVIVAITLVGTALAVVLVFVGVGSYVVPTLLRWHRAQLLGVARTHTKLTGIELPIPVFPDPTKPAGWRAHLRWTWTMLASSGTWTLLRWALFDGLVGAVIAVAPLGLIVWGLEGVVVFPGLYLLFDVVPSEWYTFIHATGAASLPYMGAMGVFLILLGIFTGPWWVRLHGQWARWLLGGKSTALSARVEQLTTSRDEARRDAASELQRIEREVHDGTQSQLVAIGLKLGTAEMMMDTEPERARELIGQAKQDSSSALTELRGLMRGIRPPVLADRGLAAALEALAIDAGTTVTSHSELSLTYDSDLETVVYFASRELVANAIKHAKASEISLVAQDSAGVLRIAVTDNGPGGATVVPGHGLDGIRRRLSVYDGALTITSPPAGGPTTITIEVPCES